MTVLHNKWSFHVTTMFPEMGLPSSKLFVCAKESRKDVPLKRNTKDGVQSNGQGSYIQFHARTFVKCKCITKTNVLKSWRYFSDNWGEEIRMSDSFRLHTWQLPIFLFPSLLHLLFFFFFFQEKFGQIYQGKYEEIYRHFGIQKAISNQ